MTVEQAIKKIEEIAKEHNLLVPVTAEKQDFMDDHDIESMSDEDWCDFISVFERKGMGVVYNSMLEAQSYMLDTYAERFPSLVKFQ